MASPWLQATQHSPVRGVSILAHPGQGQKCTHASSGIDTAAGCRQWGQMIRAILLR